MKLTLSRCPERLLYKHLQVKEVILNCLYRNHLGVRDFLLVGLCLHPLEGIFFILKQGQMYLYINTYQIFFKIA